MKMAVAILMLLTTTAFAVDRGQWAQNSLRQWFEGLKNGNGVGCCSQSDGIRLDDVDWKLEDGRYSVRIDKQWVEVPDVALLKQQNHAGHAVVWPNYTTGAIVVLCFIPGAGS